MASLDNLSKESMWHCKLMRHTWTVAVFSPFVTLLAQTSGYHLRTYELESFWLSTKVNKTECCRLRFSISEVLPPPQRQHEHFQGSNKFCSHLSVSIRKQHDIFLQTRVRLPFPFICFWFHTRTSIIKSLFMPFFPGDNSKSTPCIYGHLWFHWNLPFEGCHVAKCVFLEHSY